MGYNNSIINIMDIRRYDISIVFYSYNYQYPPTLGIYHSPIGVISAVVIYRLQISYS